MSSKVGRPRGWTEEKSLARAAKIMELCREFPAATDYEIAARLAKLGFPASYQSVYNTRRKCGVPNWRYRIIRSNENE